MQVAEEKKEAKSLQMEQDELAMQEQQLFNVAEESDDDEDDRTRQNLSKLLGNMPRFGSVAE